MRHVERAQSTSAAAPSPRKLDDSQPATSVLVLGDSMADWLAYGLEDALGDTPDHRRRAQEPRQQRA